MCGGIILQAGNAHGGPERQPIQADTVTHNPAEVGSLDQGKPVPPSFRAALQTGVQRADTTSHTGKTRGILGFTRFRPWSGRQIVRLVFHRTVQELQIILGRLFNLLSIDEESIRFSMKSSWLIISICKISALCSLPKGFIRMQPHTPYSTRALVGEGSLIVHTA